MKRIIYLSSLLAIMLFVVGCHKESSVDIDARIAKLGIELPKMAAPVGNYTPYQIHNNIIYISQVALKDGKIIHPGIMKSNDDIARGQLAARQTLLNILAVVKKASGGTLNKIDHVIRLDGFVASANSFTQQAKVMNGASDLLVKMLGKRGMHARSAVGVNVLPLNSAIEISAMIALK